MTSRQTFESDGVVKKMCEPSTSKPNPDTQYTNHELNNGDVSRELQMLDLDLQEKERVIQDLKSKIASFEFVSTRRYKEEINLLEVELMRKEKEISLLATGLVLSTHEIWKVHSELSAARLNRNNLVAKLLEERVKIANLRLALAKKDIDAEKLVERTQQTDGVKILSTDIEKLEEDMNTSKETESSSSFKQMQQNVERDVRGDKQTMEAIFRPTTANTVDEARRPICLVCGGIIVKKELKGVTPKEASGGKVTKAAEKGQKKK